MRRSGFTLLEVLVTTILLSLTLGLVMKHFSTPGGVLVSEQAEEIAAQMERAKATAISSGGRARFFFGAGGGAPGAGWYAAYRVAHDDTTSALQIDLKTELSSTVAFSTGIATIGPMGDSVNAAVPVPAAEVDCDAWARCTTGELPYLTYYLRDVRDPSALAAVTIGQSGSIRSWKYKKENGTWY